MKNDTYRIIIISTLFMACVLGGLTALSQDKPSGFASVEGKGLATTTGGEGGETVYVSTLSQLRTYAGSSLPYIILVQGTLQSANATELRVASNKTIVGVGDSATLINIELHLINVNNVIIRNLTVKDVGWAEMGDGDGLQVDNSHHIWIDHCHFEHCYDGLIDLRMICDYITVSWTILRNHNKTFGIGWTEENDFRKTIHHCWFDSTMRRNPSLGAGINHMYNNYLKNVSTYGNLGRGGSLNVIENGYFENTASPLGVEENALLYASGNIFENCSGSASKGNVTDKPFDPRTFYEYTLDPTVDVRTLVTTGAGPRNSISNQYTKQAGKQYTVSASAATAHGAVSPDTVLCDEGGRVAISVTPVEGYQLDHWNFPNFYDANPAVFYVHENIDLVAHFRVARYTVFVTANGKGAVSPSNAVFQIGEQATLTATPASGWAFDHWEGDLSGNTNPVTISVTKDMDIVAHFKQLVCNLVVTPNGNGSVSPANAKIDVNTQATITASPAKNWVFDFWSGDLSGTENPATITLSRDMNIVANFRQVRCNVTSRVLRGQGKVDPENTDFDFGQLVTVTAIPEAGWKLDKWVGHLTGDENPVTFAIDKDIKVWAYFVQDTASTIVHFDKNGDLGFRWTYDGAQRELRIFSSQKGKMEVTLYSTNGKKIGSEKSNNFSSEGLSFFNLSEGAYIIRVEANGVVSGGQILLKQ